MCINYICTLQPGQWAVQVLTLLISPDLGSVNIYQGPGPAEGGGGQPAFCVLCLGTSIPGRWELAVSLGPCSPLHLDLGRGVLISASLSQLPWPLMEAYVGQKCGSGPAPVKRPRGSVLWGGGGGFEKNVLECQQV